MPLLGFRDIVQLLRTSRPPTPTFTPDKYPDLSGKVIVVTGGNSGVGYESAKLLASKNARVYILSRNERSTREAISRMKSELKNPAAAIQFIKLDLSDLTSIKPAVDTFQSMEKKLDIIIHNAGVMTPPQGSKTVQGHELQLGTNVIGTFLLQKLLNPIMIQTAKESSNWTTRIVWVSSSAHAMSPQHGVVMENLNQDFHSEKMSTYGQSKAGIIIVARKYWEKEFQAHDAKILSFSLDPGALKTNLQRHMSPVTARIVALTTFPPVLGAYTELFAALSPILTEKDNAGHIIPWGRFGIVRRDVAASASGVIGERFWNFLEESVRGYY